MDNSIPMTGPQEVAYLELLGYRFEVTVPPVAGGAAAPTCEVFAPDGTSLGEATGPLALRRKAWAHLEKAERDAAA